MPHRKSPARGRLVRLLFFSLVAWALVSLGRAPRSARADDAATTETVGYVPARASGLVRSRRRSPGRLAASFAFAVLFFAGASFSAVAGDRAAALLSEDDSVTLSAEADPEADAAANAAVEEAEAAEPAPAEEAAAPEAEEEEVAPATEGTEAAAAAEAEAAPEAPAATPEAPAAPAAEVAVDDSQPEEVREGRSDAAPAPAVRATKRAHRRTPSRTPNTTPAPVVEQPEHHSHGLDPEASLPGVEATVWINRVLPDPTPASLRLSPSYASRLVSLSRRAGTDWALVLGVMRAESGRVQAPGRPATIAEVARRLHGLEAGREAWNAALGITGRTAMTDRAIALAFYYRAVGINALVKGLRAEQKRLVARILADRRIDIYAGGRDDLRAGKIDVRVVALIAYLAEAHGQVTVSSLFSGHRLFARPGVVSAHVYGHAVDISSLGGLTILGHQQPGSVTEQAVRDILLLPAEMRPRQVISLIGMGGPSFPLANHHDHIHVGY